MKMAQQTRNNEKTAQESINEELFKDFAEEIALTSNREKFPEWVHDYREQSLTKQGRNFLQLCHVLKDGGVNFKVKFPLQIDGKWKFADILIPQSHIVILLIQNHETIGLPCHSKTDRELLFGDRFRTLAIHTYEIHRVIEKLDSKEKEQPKHFIAYTDGSNNNLDPKRPAGAAYVILDGNGKELHRASKGLLGKTNNFVEMLAIISAINWVPLGASVTVHSDSQYAIGVLSGQMKAKKNLNLIERYKQVSDGKDVSFEWVRGHNGDYWNEVCDQMARAEYEKIKL